MFGWALLAACTNSGLDRADSTGTGDTAAPTAGDCPWIGEWELSSIACGGFGVDEWPEEYGSASMSVTQSGDGGCAVEATIEGPDCTQTEEWHFSAPVGSVVDIALEGVTRCRPDGCGFPGGALCEEGAGQDNLPQGYISDTTGDLEAKNLLSDTVSTCTLDVISVWTPK